MVSLLTHDLSTKGILKSCMLGRLVQPANWPSYYYAASQKLRYLFCIGTSHYSVDAL
jgi:hypothetical protein